MNRNNRSSKAVLLTVQGAMIAAVYVIITMAFAPFSFGPVQFRISEALTVLPFLRPQPFPESSRAVFWLIFWAAARSGKSAPGRPEPVRGRDFWGRHRIIPDPAAEERDENRYAGPGKWTV